MCLTDPQEILKLEYMPMLADTGFPDSVGSRRHFTVANVAEVESKTANLDPGAALSLALTASSVIEEVLIRCLTDLFASLLEVVIEQPYRIHEPLDYVVFLALPLQVVSETFFHDAPVP